jgi:hypothetical protein
VAIERRRALIQTCFVVDEGVILELGAVFDAVFLVDVPLDCSVACFFGYADMINFIPIIS